MSKKRSNVENKKFEDKYGKDAYFTLMSILKGKPLVDELKEKIIVDERDIWVEEVNTNYLRGKAYMYINNFAKEVVIDFLELDEEDKLGFKEYQIIGFRELYVTF